MRNGKADFAVVGAGVMGLATAWALARRGQRVVVYEQFVVGHVRGSSHGSARIFRFSYPEAEWVALAQQALPLWRELEAEAGFPVLETTGLLDVGYDLSGYRAAFAARDVEFEEIDRADAVRRFGFTPPERVELLFQPDGGVLHAERAQVAFRLGAEAGGAEVRERTRVERLEEVDADAVVVTAGAWAGRLLADVGFDLPVTPTRETVAFFPLPRAPHVPAIIDESGTEYEGHAYALATPEGLLKVGLHKSGPPTDPDEAGSFDSAIAAGAANWVARRFGGEPPPASRVETCLYTNTSDERFIRERHGRYVVGSACSGHGFKFAPAIGERLAELALETAGKVAESTS